MTQHRSSICISPCIMPCLGLGNKGNLEALYSSSTRPLPHRNVTLRPQASVQDDDAQPRREAEERKKRDLSAHRRRHLQRSRNFAELCGARPFFAEHGPHMGFCKGGLSARVVTVCSKEYPQPGGTWPAKRSTLRRLDRLFAHSCGPSTQRDLPGAKETQEQPRAHMAQMAGRPQEVDAGQPANCALASLGVSSR